MQPITEAAIRQHLHTNKFGHTMLVEPLLASTNTTARALAQQGAAEGTVVIANEQSAGRGTRARTFFSPQGGVYLSIVLHPRADDVGLITSCAAVAVARAIERLCPLKIAIKWVNDLYVHKRKVCGILTEADFMPDNTVAHIILGIGINVAAVTFPPDIASIATSLGNEGYTPNRAALIAAILEEWEAAYATISSRDFLRESRHRSCVLGHTIAVHRGEASYRARAIAIDNDGHLTVETDHSQITLHSGEVSIKIE